MYKWCEVAQKTVDQGHDWVTGAVPLATFASARQGCLSQVDGGVLGCLGGRSQSRFVN